MSIDSICRGNSKRYWYSYKDFIIGKHLAFFSVIAGQYPHRLRKNLVVLQKATENIMDETTKKF